jgi:hypothetical protein
MNSSTDSENYYLVTSFFEVNQHRITVYQKIGTPVLIDFSIKGGTTISIHTRPFLSNHPLSSRVTLSSSNYTGSGINPYN